MTGQPLPPNPPIGAPQPQGPWRRRGRRLAIGLGVALTCLALLCCTGVAYIGYDAYRAPREQRAMEVFATDLCRSLATGDTHAVYTALSADARDRYSSQELARGLAARGVTRCDVERATYLFLLLAYVVIEDDHGRHTFDLVKEVGEWKVESDLLHDLESSPRHGGGGGFGD